MKPRRLAAPLIGVGVLTYLYFLARDLKSRVSPTPAFGSVFVPYGWLYTLAGLLTLIALIFVGSLLYTTVRNRVKGREQSPWSLFSQGVTHLFIWVFLALVYYPIFQVVSASFDPRNTLFSFKAVESPFLLIRAKVIPDFSQVSLENYSRLFDGFMIQPFQWGLVVLMLIVLATLAVIALYRSWRVDTHRLASRQSMLTLALVLLTFVLTLSVVPEQFTGRATENKFLLWVRNTLLVASFTGILSVMLTATAGYAFARFRQLPGRFSMLMSFIFIQMFPGFLTLIAIFYLMSRLDLLNTLTGLVLAYSGGVISFGTWVYKEYLESLGTTLEEAAMIDGASRWQAFTRIVLPLSRPIFVFIFLLQFVGAYSEFILANLFLTGIDSWTVGIGLYSFTTGQFNTRWGIFAAASILGSLPILVIFYGFQQAFVSGYTAGAVKE